MALKKLPIVYQEINVDKMLKLEQILELDNLHFDGCLYNGFWSSGMDLPQHAWLTPPPQLLTAPAAHATLGCPCPLWVPALCAPRPPTVPAADAPLVCPANPAIYIPGCPRHLRLTPWAPRPLTVPAADATASYHLYPGGVQPWLPMPPPDRTTNLWSLPHRTCRCQCQHYRQPLPALRPPAGSDH